MSDVAGAAMKETTKAAVSEAGTMPVKVTVQIVMPREQKVEPPPPPVRDERK